MALEFVTRAGLLIAIVVSLNGCDEVGGGGSTHVAPIGVRAGQPTELILELSVWGTENSTIDSRYKDVVCKYRVKGEGEFAIGKMERSGREKKKEFYRFELPPTAAKMNSEIEYYMEFTFDGVANQRGSPQSPYRIPVR